MGERIVQIIKFAADWVTFEHEGTCYSIRTEYELASKELCKIANMPFEEVKAKYNLTLDSVDDGSHPCCC